MIDIITNNTNASQRMVTINNQKFYIRPTKIEINNNNVYVLQLLDLLKDINNYSEYPTEYLTQKIQQYIKF